VPASASPAGFYLPFTSQNCKPPPHEGWGIFNRNNGEFSTGIDRKARGNVVSLTFTLPSERILKIVKADKSTIVE
jgi:hypothetical protein